jgi:hypothetical protein
MYTHNSGIRWLTAGLMIAAVGFPAGAAARYAPDVPGSPTGTPSCEVIRADLHLDRQVCHQALRHPPRKHAHQKRAAARVTRVPAGRLLGTR